MQYYIYVLVKKYNIYLYRNEIKQKKFTYLYYYYFIL